MKVYCSVSSRSLTITESDPHPASKNRQCNLIPKISDSAGHADIVAQVFQLIADACDTSLDAGAGLRAAPRQV